MKLDEVHAAGKVLVDLPSYVQLVSGWTAYSEPWRWWARCECGWVGAQQSQIGTTGPKRLAKLDALRHVIVEHEAAMQLEKS